MYISVGKKLKQVNEKLKLRLFWVLKTILAVKFISCFLVLFSDILLKGLKMMLFKECI